MNEARRIINEQARAGGRIPRVVPIPNSAAWNSPEWTKWREDRAERRRVALANGCWYQGTAEKRCGFCLDCRDQYL